MKAMEEMLLVDGYNMIGAWPRLSKLKDTNLESARRELIDLLAEYQAFSGMKVIIVFDAYLVPGPANLIERNKIQLYYTKEKETADECIERLIGEFSARRRQIYVATSDFIEQHVIFGKGALRISARELLDMVEQNNKAIKEKLADQFSPKRETFDHRISNEIKKVFEKWRRGQ